jgi:hypothetical protein
LASNPSLAPHFSDYSFLVHKHVNQDDQHLLAHAMASDFSVAWQCLSKRTIGFSLRIKRRWTKKNNRKKWRAEEEERHKGSLTQKNKKNIDS